MHTSDSIRALFLQRFKETPRLFFAPGRINLIGEHTDYNQGWVLPAAIDLGLWFAIAPNETAGCQIHAADINQDAVFSLPAPPASNRMWVNYLAGITHTTGLKANQGFNCVFGGNLPPGSGLSSSAAMECGLAFALNTLFHLGFERMDLARLAQRSSNEFVGVPCGIMDQFASLMGRPETALLLDCRDLSYEPVAANFGAYTLLLVNSGVHHELAASAYGERVRECAAGVALLAPHYPGISSLRDVTWRMLEAHQADFDDITYKRCRYVVLENERVAKACAVLKAGDIAGLGVLLRATHQGLQEDYAVSCPELDFLAAFANDFPGVAGARMMGGGFGGCTLNLLKKSVAGVFKPAIQRAYLEAFGVEATVLEVNISGGVAEAK
ncbi:MAG: galactokinase [Saprospiraceae bacterium]|nr:galactokinase [Saprospiraceae bacterium]